MHSVTIRPYRPADLDACRRLWGELVQRHRDLYADPTIGGDETGRYFDEHLAHVGAGRIWVAEWSSEVVGFAGLVSEGDDAEVEPVVVAAAHRGQGIGAALLRHVVNEARRLGVRYLSVRPVARNEDAIRFFHDQGFRTLGRIELFMDLQPASSGSWRPGPRLYGCDFAC